MSAAASPPPSLALRRFSVDEYHRLVDAGAFEGGEPVELLEGWIATKMTRRPPHDAVVDLVAEVLRRLLPPGWRVRVQSALTTAESEPEPDLAVVRGEALDYLERHPGPGDTALVVEVADTSLERDRAVKARLYACAGVACYWILDLADGWVEVYTGPSGPCAAPSYHQRRDHRAGDVITLELPGGVPIACAAADLLPRAR